MHACLGGNLTLECTVIGEGRDTTVWQGTAFRGCDNNEILLLHNRFKEAQGASGVCNGGAIQGWSVRVGKRNSTYISRLEVEITAEMIGKDIVCNRDNGTVYAIGHHLITIGIYNII